MIVEILDRKFMGHRILESGDMGRMLRIYPWGRGYKSASIVFQVPPAESCDKIKRRVSGGDRSLPKKDAGGTLALLG